MDSGSDSPQTQRAPEGADPRPDPEAQRPGFRVPAALGFYGGLLALAWLWRGVLGDGTAPFLDHGASLGGAWPCIADLGLGLLAGLLLVVASRQWTARSLAGRQLAQELRRLLGAPGPGAIVVLALSSGIAEEALFRGALQPQLGLVGTSLLFGLAHLVPRRGLWPWAGFALLAGLVFGALFAWRGNLIAPAAAHALVNALNLRWLTRR